MQQTPIQHSRLRSLGARDRLICLGDYHEDLPDGMLSISEQEELGEADIGEEMTF
jgi:hypothetical protein